MSNPEQVSPSRWATRISALLLLWLSCLWAGAQTLIQGEVKDAVTKASLPDVNISITKSGQGTASDGTGNFFITLEGKDSKAKMRLSCIGYASLNVSLDSLLSSADKFFTFNLKPSPIELQEVLVKQQKISPEELLREVIQAIPQNYYQLRFNMEFYSTIKLQQQKVEVFQVETILKTYRKGYVSNAPHWSKIVQKRAIGKDPIKPWIDKKTGMKYSIYNPGFDVFGPDNLTFQHVLDPKKVKRMNFSFEGISVFDSDTVCAIRYGRKKTAKEDSEEQDEDSNGGVLYVAINNLAVVRNSISFHTTKVDIIYKRHQGAYFPYVIKTERLSKQGDTVYVLTNEAILQKIQTNDVEVIDYSSDNPEYIQYNEIFWAKFKPAQQLKNE
ncbi:MAG: carboxypeptidase-like regulatory domain-containing protein [Cyclobacteriaceae bacterium]|nr:carboxypeptidase-like regulatory domain-containing protein [Cyclobacteriaceae bacterium]